MKTLAIVTTTALLSLPVLAAAPAQASHGGGADVRRSGSCSGTTHWTIKAGPDDGRIEVEAEIDSNRNGQTWHWTLRHNGRVAATGRSTTHRPSGSFTVERRTGDAAGRDTFRFTATNRASGETCVARVSR